MGSPPPHRAVSRELSDGDLGRPLRFLEQDPQFIPSALVAKDVVDPGIHHIQLMERPRMVRQAGSEIEEPPSDAPEHGDRILRARALRKTTHTAGVQLDQLVQDLARELEVCLARA